MPPFVGRKRIRSTPPPSIPPAKRSTVFDLADQPTTSSSVKDNKAFIESLEGSDSDTSLSDVSSSEFEDVEIQPAFKKRKTEHDDEDDEEMEWEDAMPQESASKTSSVPQQQLGDLQLTLDKGDPARSLVDLSKKKGPSKIERQIRISTHCMHVQFLLFHNLIRNGWACDKKAQETLVGQLPAGVQGEVEKWKNASGMDINSKEERMTAPKRVAKGRRGKGKSKDDPRSQREWGEPAERREKGAPNMSSGDPILRLLRVLAAYWKKRFTITAPNLRKEGYKTLARLEEEIGSFKNDKHNPEEHGERVEDVRDFRKLAKTCEGSRDIGAQLFVALIRSLGIEARLVASLQPVGFGWGKNEDAAVKRRKDMKRRAGSNEDLSSDDEVVETPKPKKSREPKAKTSHRKVKQNAPIDPSEASASDVSKSEGEDDDESVVDITPSLPKRKPNQNYDRDMIFPTYWAEVISPITNVVYPVDPFILNPPVANNAEHLSSFEPRGAKADKAKLVMAYVVAHSSDGTAKEVTTRYLKRHMWPGRTKGVRMPVEKVPIYNKRGKIKYHEDFDWFKTVMSGYERPDRLRTAVDDLEEETDLKPMKPEKKESAKGEESLQAYKSSAEFVLERHLRREEALRPGVEPVKHFSSGKGEKAKSEPVFLRKDILVCRTGESWHKEGRQVKGGEHPIKMVPVRAVTLTRKREVEEAEREGGEKLKQGLYSWDQTEWIIPPPIKDGIIPKNAFGNMDVYVPSMVPKGAVHIPLRATMKICKRLGIEYAEAVTGFEFGNKRAVPVITGVVVAEENEHAVIDEWEKDEEERRRKEDDKREKLALHTWKKFLMGLRIIERVRDEYGGDPHAHLKEDINPFTNQNKKDKKMEERVPEAANEETADGMDEDKAGGFIVDDRIDANVEGGGFMVDDDEDMLDAAPMDKLPNKPNVTDDPEDLHQAPSNSELIVEGAAPVQNRFANINGRGSTSLSFAQSSDAEEPTALVSKSAPKKRGRQRGQKQVPGASNTSDAMALVTPPTEKTQPRSKSVDALLKARTQHRKPHRPHRIL